MDKQRLDVLVDTNHVTVELLGPKLARVVDPNLSAKVSENDIIRLSHDPGDAADMPQMVEILYKTNPVITEIEVFSEANRNRMVALAAVLGAEILDIEDTEFSGTIRIAHAEEIDIEAIAEAAGVTDDFDDEDEMQGEGALQGLPNFDQYLRKPVFIPFFGWDDGETRPFQGYCRGNGPIAKEKKWEQTIGVYTKEGKYFAVVIDNTVEAAFPQFWIDDKPFHFPIVSFGTMGARVDPDTGNLKLPPKTEQGQAASENRPAAELKSAQVESGHQANETTSSPDQQ